MPKARNKRVAKVAIEPRIETAMNCSAWLTIATAHKLRDNVLVSLAANNTVFVDVSEATDADLAGLQILYAARKYASENGKTLIIKAPEDSLVHEKAKSAGRLFVEMLQFGGEK